MTLSLGLICVSCRLGEELQNDQLITTCIECNQEIRVIACPVDLVHCLVSLKRHILLESLPASVHRVKRDRARAHCSRMNLFLGPILGCAVSPTRGDKH